jgi:membrane-bound ClpP family serine protease
MSWLFIIILIVVGVLFLVLEVLVIPGTSVAGILGFIGIMVGVWQAFAQYGTLAGYLTLAVTSVVTAITMYYALKSNTWKRFMLKDTNTSQVNVIEKDKIKPGDIAITVSRLAPAGTIEFEGGYYEAHSYGEFIDPAIHVQVLKVENGKVFVKLNT